MTGDIEIAFYQQFMVSLANLPNAIQKKTNAFPKKFAANPTSSGINFERLNGTNPDYRSVRIGKAYRAILLMPKSGNQYVMLWVDRHDDAYDWASRTEVRVHPRTVAATRRARWKRLQLPRNPRQFSRRASGGPGEPSDSTTSMRRSRSATTSTLGRARSSASGRSSAFATTWLEGYAIDRQRFEQNAAKSLVDDGRLVRTGEKRGIRYEMPSRSG